MKFMDVTRLLKRRSRFGMQFDGRAADVEEQAGGPLVNLRKWQTTRKKPAAAKIAKNP